MEKESVKCPKCGKNVLMDESREIVFCTYCGEKIVVHNKTEKTSALEKNEVKLEKSKRVVPLQSKKTIRGNNKAGVIIAIIATVILSIIVVVAVITSINNDGDISDGYTDEYQDEESSSSLEEEHLTEVPEGYIGIFNAEDFDNFISSQERNYILMNDVDLANYDFHHKDVGAGELIVRGDFNGNHYCLKNYKANRPLFDGFEENGCIHDLNIDNFHIIDASAILVNSISMNSDLDSPIVIQNTHITNSSIICKNHIGYLGTLAGSCFNSVIINCSFDGNISVNISKYEREDSALVEHYEAPEYKIGGISGFGNCQYCYTKGSLSVVNNGAATPPRIGGIIGDGFAFGSYNQMNLKVKNEWKSYVGGVVGSTEYYVEQCCNFGNIKVDDNGSSVGGVCGGASVIRDCFNRGNVCGRCVGGIVGSDINEMMNCYNIGEVNNVESNAYKYEDAYIGGLCGGFVTNNETIENCYYTNNLLPTGNEEFKNPFIKVISVEDTQNEEIFVGFDFSNIWEMGYGEHSYPILQCINYDEN